MRRSESIVIGAGDNKLMEFRVRGHANFTETVPFALILLGLIEYNNYVPQWALISLSSALVVGRALHAYAFSFLHPVKVHLKYRAPGFAMTLSTIGISGSIVLVNGVKNAFNL